MLSRWPVRARPAVADREGLRDLGVLPAPLAQARRHRRRHPARRHQQRVGRAAGVAEAEPDSGAGERDPAPGGGVLRPRDRPKMSYPLVLDLAADGIPVAVTCRVLGFSKQAFYAWRQDPLSQRDWDEAHLINAALDIHADDPAFGYRSSPMSWPAAASSPGRTRSPGCALSSGSGQRSPGDAAWPAKPGRRFTMTWSPGSSLRPARTAPG